MTMAKRSSMLSGYALAVGCVAAIAAEFSHNDIVLVIASAAIATYIGREFRRTPILGKAIATVAAIAIVLVMLFTPEPAKILHRGFSVGTLLTVFVVAMNLLREAAQTSRLIRRSGQHILAQPPHRRYGALTIAGNLFGVLTAFGVVNLLGVMIVRASRAGGQGDARGVDASERRAMLAILRGFGNTALWSPVAVPFAVVATGYPGLRWLDILPLGVTTAALLLFVGWIVDAASNRGEATSVAAEPVALASWTVHLRLAMLIASLFVLLLTVDALIGRRFIVAAVVAVPVFAACWIGSQRFRFGPRRAAAAVGRRMQRVIVRNFASQRLETTVLACAGFLGAIIAATANPDTIAAWIRESGMPTAAIAIGVIWLIMALGHIGVTPVVVTALLIASVPEPEALGMSTILFAVTLLGAWGLTQQSSPLNIPVLIAGQLLGRSSHVVGQRWNGPYAIIGGIVHSIWIYGLYALGIV